MALMIVGDRMNKRLDSVGRIDVMTTHRVGDPKLVNFASHVDDNTIEQAKQTASMPFVHPHVALMPDAHSGKGSAVGTVIPTIDAVIPAAVGVDIGCGMIAARTEFTAADIQGRDLAALRTAIESTIPLSPGNYNTTLGRFPFTEGRITDLEHLAQDGGTDLSHSPKWREQLGSLGGGNHFIELCLDQADRVWLFLHSGSRGVGNKIAQKHIRVAQKLMKRWWIDLPNPDLAYLPQGTPEFTEYLRELNWAQRFAFENRAEMMDRFMSVFAAWMGYAELDRPHTAGDFEVERVNCFAGETQVITRMGTRPIEALAGGQHELLTDGGEWVKAPIMHFGRQEVTEVTLIRSGVLKTIRATAEHRWLLLTRRGRKYEATTAKLNPGDKMQPVFAKQPAGRTTVDQLSAARGFVYGDGAMKGRRSCANFCGTKDEAMIPYFNGVGNPLRTYGEVKRITGLPGEWKSDRPALDSDPSVLYGWLAGYFAADGDVGKTGRPTLSSASIENLEYVRTACQVVGIGTFGIRARIGKTGYSNGRLVTQYLVGLMRGDLDGEFFLIPEHRRRFEAGRGAAERRHWRGVLVRPTGEWTDVYCATVDGTHSFALADNILTGNCHHNYTRKERHGGRDVWLTRKGAIDAHTGVVGLIPGSMGTRSYVVRGKGNAAGLCSAPHGAGRRFSRNEARRRFTADDLAQRMQGIEYRHGEEWIDEIPDAYKDIDVVMADAAGLVDIEHELRQVLNVKGT
ncbi:RNA-splicing ligase RtcB [Mycolicibacterium neworleansense]|uniref:3'-phosphate/5'-hydroxy nucleic acid ligase n=1 Tax=Mycolicibacterium neworleansense TaxID=146018 RepID=A0A0H5RW08_9MYCO|nr:RNA-splicing ligase RtcB [Mycolicibacterium neworleansense]